MLHTIPLTVVESRKEVDDVKELLGICKEYHTGLRCELKRKVREGSRGGGRGACTAPLPEVAGQSC